MDQMTRAKQHARQQARAQLDSIVNLMDAIEAARDGKTIRYEDEWLGLEELEERARERPLSILVRSEWSLPGSKLTPGEYEVLLCTGGPAVRIRGELSEYGEPASARIESQDWFTPWERLHTDSREDEPLLRFAALFWFGQ